LSSSSSPAAPAGDPRSVLEDVDLRLLEDRLASVTRRHGGEKSTSPA